MNCNFLHIITYGCNIEQPAPDNVMRLKIQKWKCACGSTFIKIIWKPFSLKMSRLRVRSSGSGFGRNYQRTKGCRS